MLFQHLSDLRNLKLKFFSFNQRRIFQSTVSPTLDAYLETVKAGFLVGLNQGVIDDSGRFLLNHMTLLALYALLVKRRAINSCPNV